MTKSINCDEFTGVKQTPQQYESIDPLQNAQNESQLFNFSWLKNGEAQKPIQKIGFGLISLLACFFGICFFIDSLEFYQSGDSVFFLTFGLASLLFLVPGILGLRNILRRKIRRSLRDGKLKCK